MSRIKRIRYHYEDRFVTADELKMHLISQGLVSESQYNENRLHIIHCFQVM